MATPSARSTRHRGGPCSVAQQSSVGTGLAKRPIDRRDLLRAGRRQNHSPPPLAHAYVRIRGRLSRSDDGVLQSQAAKARIGLREKREMPATRGVALFAPLSNFSPVG